jgi:uncharacterized membrane protein YgdD (TMEM256/DUF423 family)
MGRVHLVVGSLLGAAGVALGAFGAHGLRGRVDAPLLVVWETAARYHLVHALAVIAAAWVIERGGGRWARWAGWLLAGGVVVFSGSLYLMTLTGWRWLGAITPVGGVALVAGWLALARAAWATPPPGRPGDPAGSGS